MPSRRVPENDGGVGVSESRVPESDGYAGEGYRGLRKANFGKRICKGDLQERVV